MTDHRSSRPLSTAISLCLALSILAQPDDCITGIRIVRVALSQSAKLICAGLDGGTRSVLLRKEDQLIHNLTINGKDPQELQVNENMLLQVEGHNVLYEFRQVSNADAGVYTCEMQRIYPPPYKTEKRTLALITEAQCPETPDQNQTRVQNHAHHQGHKAPLGDSPPNQLLTWQVICVGMTLLCAVLLVIILVLGHKVRRNAQRDCDYVNTRPKPTLDAKKTKGVMQPKWAGQLF